MAAFKDKVQASIEKLTANNVGKIKGESLALLEAEPHRRQGQEQQAKQNLAASTTCLCLVQVSCVWEPESHGRLRGPS